MKLAPLVTGMVTLAIVVAACSQAVQPTASEPTASPDETAGRVDSPGPPILPPLIKSPWSEDGTRAILGTADLGIGTNRFGFLLTSPDGFVTAPEAQLTLRFVADGDAVVERATADVHPWPFGIRGFFATDLTFDRAGAWTVDIESMQADGTRRTAQLAFEVLERASTPQRGDPAIPSVSKTLADVGSISELATGSLQDPDLYQLTIADAIANGRPTILVIASPAFCTNAVCGPQIEVLQELKNSYGGLANFIHVDFFDNPAEVQQDIDAAIVSPTAVEWGIPSIEWTFVIDRDGNIAKRFEAFATRLELERALIDVL
ncbi:MAG: hypothetical protein IIC82_05420 [Chloroflexi bacterium]|nr:hypothetical protein [Chloroflexota bacterium]